jgi:hypothetical protein
MTTQRIFVLSSALVLYGSFSFAQSSSSAPPPAQKADAYQMQVQPPKPDDKPKAVVIPDRKLTSQGRMEIIRGMTAELGYARKAFPFGKSGLTLKEGKLVDPTEEKLQEMLTVYGPAVKVGEPAHITDVKFKEKAIVFDINGGPERKKKWYEHIEMGGNGGIISPGQPSDNTNIHGSFVELTFDKFVPDLTPAQLKQLLDPVINFNAKSATQAYLDTIPPPAKKAIAEHKALVGMDRDMVTYALGRPPQKYRDKDADGTEYEEWIYGTPPADVQFVRFVGDEVIRIETMQVDGTKTVRTEKEVIIPQQQPEVAQQGPQPPTPGQQPQAQNQSQTQPGGGTADSQDSSSRPSLRRPGEDVGQPPEQDRPKKIPGPVPTGGQVPDQTQPANTPPQ